MTSFGKNTGTEGTTWEGASTLRHFHYYICIVFTLLKRHFIPLSQLKTENTKNIIQNKMEVILVEIPRFYMGPNDEMIN